MTLGTLIQDVSTPSVVLVAAAVGSRFLFHVPVYRQVVQQNARVRVRATVAAIY